MIAQYLLPLNKSSIHCFIMGFEFLYFSTKRDETNYLQKYNYLQKQQITANSSKKFTEINNWNKNQAIPVDM